MSEWRYRLKRAANGWIVSEDDAMVCDVFMTNDRIIAEKRTRLISAAPDLYAACKAIADTARSGMPTWEDIQRCVSAVAKADGAK